EQVHPANQHPERVFGRQVAGCAHGLSPIELDVWPVAEPDLLLKEPNQLARLTVADHSGAFRLTETIEDLHSLPRCPNHFGRSLGIKESYRGRVMIIAPAFVSEPPGGVRVNPHFLSERRKATPSNRGALGSPTARFSASRRVIRGRLRFEGGNCL